MFTAVSVSGLQSAPEDPMNDARFRVGDASVGVDAPEAISAKCTLSTLIVHGMQPTKTAM